MVRAALLLLPFLGVTSCAQLENVVQATRAQVTLVDGLRKFDAGEHPASAKALQRAIALGLGAKDRAEAHKHLAFIHCTAGREARCRDEFGKAIEADPGMRLDAAEAGHPVWGPIFRSMSGPGALSAGLKQYEDGDYAESAKNLQGAIELGIADKERVTAHKHLHPLRVQPGRAVPRGVPQGARRRSRARPRTRGSRAPGLGADLPFAEGGQIAREIVR
jgi:tetratricopeptide (TPR) repeat protein